MTPFAHESVMTDEVISALRVQAGGRYCDATLGGGGHAIEILRRCGPDGMLLGLDRDPEALAHVRQRLAAFGQRAVLCRGNFAELLRVMEDEGVPALNGIVADLGVSSHQLTVGPRGFSFARPGPLDMRMDPAQSLTAERLIAESSVAELERIVNEYGEEREARRLAGCIKRAFERGQLTSTAQLADVVAQALPWRTRKRTHPATKTFQALRIAVNDELGSLERLLAQLVDALRPGGRAAIISFHSLEDRLVKKHFARLANPCVCPPRLPVCGCGKVPIFRLLDRAPQSPSSAEVDRNPRARSAKLRAVERI